MLGAAWLACQRPKIAVQARFCPFVACQTRPQSPCEYPSGSWTSVAYCPKSGPPGDSVTNWLFEALGCWVVAIIADACVGGIVVAVTTITCGAEDTVVGATIFVGSTLVDAGATGWMVAVMIRGVCDGCAVRV